MSPLLYTLDGVELAVGGRLREQWLDEELREPVEGAGKVLLLHVEVVVRVLHRRVRVAHAWARDESESFGRRPL